MKPRALTFILPLAQALSAMAQEPAPPLTEQSWNPYAAKAGVSFPVSYTGEVLGNPTGGFRRGVVYDGVLEAGVTVDFGKLARLPGLILTVDGLYPHGSSLTRNDVGDFNVLSSIDALHNPRLYELWVEQDLDDGKFSIRAGQLPIDTEFSISSNGALYINSAFGAVPVVNPDVNVATYPVAAPGVRLRVTPNNAWSVQGGVFDGDVGDLHTTNRSGLRFKLNGEDGALLLGEVDYTLHPAPAAQGDGKQPAEQPLTGTYKLGGFYDTTEFRDNTFGGNRHGDYGGYFIMDQDLWDVPGAPDEGLKAFTETGVAPADRNQEEFYCEGGLNYQGLFPGHPKDLLGLGLCYSKLTSDLRDANGNPTPRHYETIVELTYQAILAGWINVQPDLQYIFDPGGEGNRRDALVLGLRFTMTF